MANKEHEAILDQGVDVWNQWRQANPSIKPDLSRADFSGAELGEADLSGVYLVGADLSSSVLYKANLVGAELNDAQLSAANLAKALLNEAKLTGAQLYQATLYGANLNGANLTGANLSGAFFNGASLNRAGLRGTLLKGANLSRTNLTEVDLTYAEVVETDLTDADVTLATVGEAKFGNVDLSVVKGLRSVRHTGPSYIDIRTIYRSRGQIPEAFLRGCGVPDNFITFMHSLTRQAFNFYSCFISYSDKDRAFAERLHSDLQAKGVRCWFAPHDMEIGASVLRSIESAIRRHEKLLLILSHNALQSDWVDHEVQQAQLRERQEKRHILFPVRLDDTILQNSANWSAGLCALHIGDFTGWQDDERYKVAFDRLLRDLEMTEEHES